MKVKTIKTNEVPKSGWKNMSNQGNITIVKGINKSLKLDITFLSNTKARVKMVLNLATSEGWKEKIPKLNHLWAPYTDMPKKRTNTKEIKEPK